MPETWLRPNRRALAFGMVLPTLIVLLGLPLVAGLASGWGDWTRVLGLVFLLLGGALLVGLAWQMSRPRIAYERGSVLFGLRSGQPVAVPIDVVEGFLLAQGHSHLPGARPGQSETVNLVARLAERAVEWHRVEVKPALGAWCDGYVTIRGAWCEPLNEDVARRLNRVLADAKRASTRRPA